MTVTSLDIYYWSCTVAALKSHVIWSPETPLSVLRHEYSDEDEVNGDECVLHNGDEYLLLNLNLKKSDNFSVRAILKARFQTRQKSSSATRLSCLERSEERNRSGEKPAKKPNAKCRPRQFRVLSLMKEQRHMSNRSALCVDTFDYTHIRIYSYSCSYFYFVFTFIFVFVFVFIFI